MKTKKKTYMTSINRQKQWRIKYICYWYLHVNPVIYYSDDKRDSNSYLFICHPTILKQLELKSI